MERVVIMMGYHLPIILIHVLASKPVFPSAVCTRPTPLNALRGPVAGKLVWEYCPLWSTNLKTVWHYSVSEWMKSVPDSQVHGAHMGPTWVLLTPDGPHVCPMNYLGYFLWCYGSVIVANYIYRQVIFWNTMIHTLRLRQSGRHFPDDIFNCIFFNDNLWILITIPLKFAPEGPIYNVRANGLVPTRQQAIIWANAG